MTTLKQKRKDLVAVWFYRSGEDSIGSVYLGSLVKTKILKILDAGDDLSFYEKVRAANEEKVEKAYALVASTINYMHDHPMRRCPLCGQIQPQDGE